jgi:hypothetical protein
MNFRPVNMITVMIFMIILITESQKSEDRSETSSNRSAASGQGSNSNSGTSSLRGSASSTPCTSPQPSGSPGKWAESSAHPSRFFVMKCNNHKNLEFSYSKGLWATVSKNEKALNKSLEVRSKKSHQVMCFFM